MTTQTLISDSQVLQARFAARLAASLTASTAMLPNDISERLRVARDQALGRARLARQAQAATAGSVLGVTRNGAAVLGHPGGWPRWVASMMPLVLLLVGLLSIGQLATHEQILAAAEIDTLLLADDLPPAAYSDPGFAEYLRSGPAL